MNLLPSKEKGRKTAKVGLVLAGASALVVMGMAGPAAAIHNGEARAEGSAASGTGIFDPIAELLETDACRATFLNGGPMTRNESQCTPTLATNPAQLVTRFATANVAANGDATSSAEGGVASVPITRLPDELDLTALKDALVNTNPDASALGPVFTGLGGLLANLTPVLDALDTLLNQAAGAIDDSVPVDLEIGAVQAECSADANTARASSNVSNVNLNVVLGPQTIPVVFQTPVQSHSTLIRDAPQQLVDGILIGLETSILGGNTGPLDALLLPLGGVLTQVRQQLIDALLTQLRPTVLDALQNALDPLLSGEVNHVSDPAHPTLEDGPWEAPDRIELTALSLTVLGDNTLTLGHVICGDNVAGTPDGGGGNPGLQVLKTEKVDGDDEAEFTIRVHNPLDHAVDDVFVKDFYPKELDEKDVKVSSISKGSFNKNTGVWTVGTLASGATETLRIKAELDEDDLADGVDNAICVNRTSKPNHIQKNDSFKDDTDGCDTANAKSDDNGDDDDDDSPKSINSGISGGDLSAAGLAGLLAMTAMGGSVARRRFNT